MKKAMTAAIFIVYLLLSFLCFTSFNFKSTEIILSSMNASSDFYKKTQNALKIFYRKLEYKAAIYRYTLGLADKNELFLEPDKKSN